MTSAESFKVAGGANLVAGVATAAYWFVHLGLATENATSVEYTVREEELPVVIEAIARFVHAVRAAEPSTHYRAYRRGESSSFLHLMAFPGETAELVHRRAAHTETFVETLYPRCVQLPRFTTIEAIGAESP
jgi:quinol monooxygenase YgiN